MSSFLFWLTKIVIVAFWLMDILNMPFMEMFDTTYPLNGWFWFLFFMILGSDIKIKITESKENT